MALVRRIAAIAGLVLLVPLALAVARGQIGLADAGLRAAVVVIVVVLVTRLTPRVVLAFADTLDGTWKGEPVALPEADEDVTAEPAG